MEDNSDIMHMLEFTFKFIGVIGLNPKHQNAFSKFNAFTTFLCLFTMAALHLYWIIINWYGPEAMDTLMNFTSMFLSVIKILFLILNQRPLLQVARKLYHFWPVDRFGNTMKDEMLRLHNQVFKRLKIYVLTIFIACFFLFGPMARGKVRIPIRIVTLCDLEQTPCFLVYLTWQVEYIFGPLFFSGISVELLFIALIFHAFAGIEMIKAGLKVLSRRIGHGATLDEVNCLMQQLVEQHDVLLDFINSLNNLFSEVLLMYFSMQFGTLVLCLVSATPKGESQELGEMIQFLPMYTVLVLQLAIITIAGDIIVEQSADVSREAFHVDWSRHPKLRSSLTLMVLRSQRAKKMSLGNLIDLNAATLASVVKATYSIYTFLNAQ